MNTKIIKLDINRRLYDKIVAKQDDTKSRFLLFQLLDGAVPFNLTDRSVRVYGVKPDGAVIFNDLTVTHSTTGFCLLELTNQMLAIVGTVKLELMITEGDKKLTSIPFDMEVIKKINSNDAVESSNEFRALLNALKEIDEWNKEFADKSGKLEELYTPRLNELGSQLETKVNVYNTVNDMKKDSNIKNGVRCKTLGFREAGDGGGGYYIVTEDTPNGCNILKINDLLSAKLIVEDVVNFKQVGGNGWGQNDLLSNYFTTLEEAKLTYPKATSLNMTINDVLFKVVLENFKDLYIPEGVYYFNYNISIPSYKNIYGAGNKQTFLKQNSTIQFITLDGNYINLSDFIAVSNSENKADFGIVINRDKNFNRFNNITVQYFKTGIRINTNSFLTDLNEVNIYNCDNYGLDVADENNVLNIDKCKVNECGIGIQCISARNINISKSWIELCNIGILKKDKGNLNITDTYFERNAVACIKIAWGITPCELIKINGCSFFTDTSNSIINYHGLSSTKMIVENSYFTEYDTDNSLTSKIFEKGNAETSMKPIFKNCFLNGGITMGITESDYTS